MKTGEAKPMSADELRKTTDGVSWVVKQHGGTPYLLIFFDDRGQMNTCFFKASGVVHVDIAVKKEADAQFREQMLSGSLPDGSQGKD